MTPLALVRDFANKAHGAQMRKYTPERYIVHPERVMKLCAEHTSDDAVLAAALLHDVLEDTPVSKEEICNFLSQIFDHDTVRRTIQYVVELTDVYIKQSYPQLNRRKRKQLEADRIAKTSPESQTIKYADILDNCREIVQHDRGFAGVFLSECRGLLKVMHSGNQHLRAAALEAISKAQAKL